MKVKTFYFYSLGKNYGIYLKLGIYLITGYLPDGYLPGIYRVFT